MALGKPGGYPSDLITDGNGTLLTVDDAQIPCNVVAWPLDRIAAAPLYTVPLTAQDLVDHDGTRPARAPTTFGNGLFGAFTGDLELVFGRWLLVTVGAGNSVSDDGSSPLRLANLVVIDLQTKRVVQSVNLAWGLAHSGQTSNGIPYLGLPQSLPSMVAFVPNGGGTQAGRIYVAMSNGAGSTLGLQTFYNGTVQSWLADFTQPQPLSVDTTGKAPVDVTHTWVSDRYNPVGFTRYTNPSGHATLILTNAGASRFDASFVLQPTTDAFLEFLDLERDDWRDDWAVNLGGILPSVSKLAVARDRNGLAYGMLASQTFGAAWFVELTGLDANPVDPSRLRLLRSVDLVPGGAATAGTAFLAGATLSPGGRTALFTSFNSGTLIALGLPDDIEFGPMALYPDPLLAGRLGPARSSLGALVAPPNAVADAFFVVNGTFDASWNPVGSSYIGTLSVQGGLE